MTRSTLHSVSNLVLAGAIVWGVGETAHPPTRHLSVDSITVNDLRVRSRLSVPSSVQFSSIEASRLNVRGGITGRSLDISGHVDCRSLDATQSNESTLPLGRRTSLRRSLNTGC